MTDEKPCFLFLKREYFDLFASGEKTTEWRAWDRQFTDKTYRPGRRIVIRAGYTKGQPELSGVIVRTTRVARSRASQIARELYPNAAHFCAIEIDIQPQEQKP